MLDPGSWTLDVGRGTLDVGSVGRGTLGRWDVGTLGLDVGRWTLAAGSYVGRWMLYVVRSQHVGRWTWDVWALEVGLGREKLDVGHWTLDIGLGTWDVGRWDVTTLCVEHLTLDVGRSAVRLFGRSAVRRIGRSALNVGRRTFEVAC